MRLVDRLITRELIGPFLFGVAAFMSIFFAGRDLLKIISDMVKGMPASAAMELVFLQMPSILVMVLPMAVLLAALLALGRLSGESEIVALYAGGTSLYRIVVAVIVMGVVVSVLAFALNDSVVPAANQRSREIRAELLKEKIVVTKSVPFADVRGGVTNSLVYVQGGTAAKAHTLRSVLIVMFRNNAPEAFFTAKTAEWRGNLKRGDYTWLLRDGYSQSLTPGGLVLTKTFAETGIRVTLRHSPAEIELYQKRPEELTFGELLGHIRRLGERGISTVDEEIDLYNKVALPLAAFVFAVLASSLGLRPHRGGSAVGLGLSVLIIFVYWIVWHFTSALAKQGTVDPLLGSFSSSILALAAGFALLVKAAR